MNQNKVSILKLSKVTKSKIDLVKNTVSVAILFWDKHLSDTETTVVAYFIVYGINNQCKDLLVKSNVCKNISNVNTIMSNLKRQGLIYKDDITGKNYVCKQLNFEVTPKMCVLLKIETK